MIIKPRLKHTGKKPTGQRQLRVAEQMRHILSEILHRTHFRDPALANANAITVTSVDIGPDLKHAAAYIMPLGGKNSDEFLKALNKASGLFRSEMAKRLEMRYTPKVTFKLDPTFDEADHIGALLRQDRVQRDLLKKDDEE